MSNLPLETNASGIGMIKVEVNKATFSIEYNHINNAAVSHIHNGIDVENGPSVITLVSIADPSKQQGDLVTGGNLHEAFEGRLPGKPTEDLAELLNNGCEYININSED